MRIYSVDNSSYIKRIAFCGACNNLFIKFKKGGVYKYKKVPESKFDRMMSLDGNGSVGRYYHENIKGIHFSECIVPAGNMRDTNRFNMETVCDCTLEMPEKNLFEKLFGQKPIIEKVQAFKVNGKVYWSEEEAKKAYNLDVSIKLDRMFLGCDDDFVKEYGEAITNFIITNRDALKEIL